MRYEMNEEWGEALEVLEHILEEDEANSSARKRKISIFKVKKIFINFVTSCFATTHYACKAGFEHEPSP